MSNYSPPNFQVDHNSIVSLVKQYTEENSKELDEIIKIKATERTFENTVEELQSTLAKFFNRCNQLTFLSLVSPSKETREAANEAKSLFEKANINNSTRYDVFCALEEYRSHNDINKLDKEQRRLFDKYYQDFKRLGMTLSQEKREQVSKIRLKISDLSIQFNKNVNEDETTVLFDGEELEGMPPNFIEQLKKDEETGKYIVTLKYPHILPIYEQCKRWQTRKKLMVVVGNKCVDKGNIPILQEILKLRNEAAKVLGFESDAHFMLDIKLAKSSENVNNFLEETSKLLEPIFNQEMEHLLQLKSSDMKSRNEEFDGKLYSYDTSFYQKRRLKEKYDLDDEVVREYFPAEKVIEGVLSVYESVLSLKFERETKASLWHEDVHCYKVFDAKNKDVFYGHFYLDLFPRPQKYSHAACWPVLKRQIDKYGATYTASAMVCNFSPPSSTRPSLLKFSEVKTFFHEFGHVMHSLLSSSKYERLNWSWSAVEQDFLEVPSMCFENWSYKEDTLLKCSSHYKTGEKLPSNLIKSLSDSAVANQGFAWRRLISFASFDMQIHGVDGHLKDLASTWRESTTKHTGITPLEGTSGYASFQHMTTGYNAGYYGYLYSEVIAQDVFSRFENEGVLNSNVGHDLRKTLLEKICLEDGNKMILDFLGRNFNQNAFLKRLGLKVN